MNQQQLIQQQMMQQQASYPQQAQQQMFQQPLQPVTYGQQPQQQVYGQQPAYNPQPQQPQLTPEQYHQYMQQQALRNQAAQNQQMHPTQPAYGGVPGNNAFQSGVMSPQQSGHDSRSGMNTRYGSSTYKKKYNKPQPEPEQYVEPEPVKEVKKVPFLGSEFPVFLHPDNKAYREETDTKYMNVISGKGGKGVITTKYEFLTNEEGRHSDTHVISCPISANFNKSLLCSELSMVQEFKCDPLEEPIIIQKGMPEKVENAPAVVLARMANTSLIKVTHSISRNYFYGLISKNEDLEVVHTIVSSLVEKASQDKLPVSDIVYVKVLDEYLTSFINNILIKSNGSGIRIGSFTEDYDKLAEHIAIRHGEDRADLYMTSINEAYEILRRSVLRGEELNELTESTLHRRTEIIFKEYAVGYINSEKLGKDLTMIPQGEIYSVNDKSYSDVYTLINDIFTNVRCLELILMDELGVYIIRRGLMDSYTIERK